MGAPVLYFETEAYDLFLSVLASVCQVFGTRDRSQTCVIEGTPSRLTLRATDPTRTLQVVAAIPAKSPQGTLCRPQDPSQTLGKSDGAKVLQAYRGDWRLASKGFGISAGTLYASLLGITRDFAGVSELLGRRLIFAYMQGATEQLRLLVAKANIECAVGLPVLTPEPISDVPLTDEMALSLTLNPRPFLRAILPLLGRTSSTSILVGVRDGALFFETETPDGLGVTLQLKGGTELIQDLEGVAPFQYAYPFVGFSRCMRVMKLADGIKLVIDIMGRLALVARLRDTAGVAFVEYRLTPQENI